MDIKTIYIQLFDEGTIVYRPTQGEVVDEMVFRVLPTDDYDPEDEHWEFPPGRIVRCRKGYFQNFEGEVLVAVEEVK